MWVGESAVLKAVLRDAGADFRWRDGNTVYEIGPELTTADEGPDSTLPIIPIFGAKAVQVNDGALYYVQGVPYDLLQILRGVPEWEPSTEVQDVTIGLPARITL